MLFGNCETLVVSTRHSSGAVNLYFSQNLGLFSDPIFFCFRPAGILEASGSDGDKTTTAVRLPNPKELSPSLVCESEGSGIEDLLLTKKHISIGRPNCGNDAEIDDELLADKHAEVKQSPDGSWRLLSLSSQNGIWAEIDELRLSQKCRFRCGEQQFLFVLT